MEEFMDLYGINLWYVYLELFNSRYHMKSSRKEEIRRNWRNYMEKFPYKGFPF